MFRTTPRWSSRWPSNPTIVQPVAFLACCWLSTCGGGWRSLSAPHVSLGPPGRPARRFRLRASPSPARRPSTPRLVLDRRPGFGCGSATTGMHRRPESTPRAARGTTRRITCGMRRTASWFDRGGLAFRCPDADSPSTLPMAQRLACCLRGRPARCERRAAQWIDDRGVFSKSVRGAPRGREMLPHPPPRRADEPSYGLSKS